VTLAYNLGNFQELRKLLNETLRDEFGAPISCRLYDAPDSNGAIALIDDTEEVIDFHIAEACNIAALVNSLERVLSLPRSNVACNELSEVLLLTLDVLRENIRDASASDRYQETEADKNIRSWAGFIKHPKDYVFAHRCFSEIYPPTTPTTVLIDSSFLKNWSGLNSRERDAKKNDLANRIVAVEMPSVCEISDFFNSCAGHLTKLVLPTV
jgi:hypothetical protein